MTRYFLVSDFDQYRHIIGDLWNWGSVKFTGHASFERYQSLFCLWKLLNENVWILIKTYTESFSKGSYSYRTLTNNYTHQYHLLYNNLTLTKYRLLVAKVFISVYLYLGVHFTVDIVLYICVTMSISRYIFFPSSNGESYDLTSVPLFVCLCVCLFVSNISGKRMTGFSRNVQDTAGIELGTFRVDCFTHG